MRVEVRAAWRCCFKGASIVATRPRRKALIRAAASSEGGAPEGPPAAGSLAAPATVPGRALQQAAPDGSDLQCFFQLHGVDAAVLACPDALGPLAPGAEAPADLLPSAPLFEAGQGIPPGEQDACRIKSLVFLAEGSPVVCVLPLERRVNRRRLAAALRVRPGAVALAPSDQVPHLCGFPVGSVPPLGHQPRLPVVVDCSVAALHSHCLTGAGTGGGTLLRLAVEDLLRATGALVADVTSPADGGSSGSVDSGSVDLGDADGSGSKSGSLCAEGEVALAKAGAAAAAASAMAALPLPWEAGSTEVTLVGLIAQRRKIARLLLFANLVPAPSEGGLVQRLAPGSGTYLRRLWRCPEGEGAGEACEVQLILGKTLGERMGRDAAAALIRNLRVGQVVRVVGRPQPHGLPPHGTRRRAVLDVVVHEIQTLVEEPMPAVGPETKAGSQAAGPAGTAASARGGGSGRAGAGGSLGPRASGAPQLQLPEDVQQRVVVVRDAEGLSLLEEALFRASASTCTSTATEVVAEAVAAAAERPAGGGHCASCSPECDVGSSGSMTGSSSGSGSAGSDALAVPAWGAAAASCRAVVGMDCEWQPYERSQPHTPVSLLQLAVRPSSPQPAGLDLTGSGAEHWPGALAGQAGEQRIFLLDLLALCGTGSGSPEAVTAAPAGERQGEAQQPQPQQQQQQQQQQQPEQGDSWRLGAGGGAEGEAGVQVPPLELALSSLLQRMFEDPGIVVVGFRLSHDLRRLCESYPHLPCFGSQGSVPFRSYVDITQLAQSVLPASYAHSRSSRAGAKLRRTGMGLSALAGLVLGRPLDKAEQCSDWGARPLTPEQQAYAATDVYALVVLFDALLLRQQQQKARTLQLLSQAWFTHMSAGVADVAAFRPSSAARSGGGSSSDGEEEREVELPSARHRRVPDAQQAAGSNGISGTLGVLCNVEHLQRQYLGRELPGGGKAPAVRAGAANAQGCEPGRTLSFPRGSGILEWSNAFMLFVNLQPAPSLGPKASPPPRYNNRFLWEAGDPGGAGCAEQGSADAQRLFITWWPGRGQTLEHPVMRRMLGHPAGGASTGGSSNGINAFAGTSGEVAGREVVSAPAGTAAAAAAGVQEDGESDGPGAPGKPPAVLLFCRPPEGSYVFCGRLRQSQLPAPGVSAGCITWQLLDWPQLRGSAAFQQLLALQQGE